MRMGQGVRTGLGHGGITCVLQTQFSSFVLFCGGGGGGGGRGCDGKDEKPYYYMLAHCSSHSSKMQKLLYLNF